MLPHIPHRMYYVAPNCPLAERQNAMLKNVSIRAPYRKDAVVVVRELYTEADVHIGLTRECRAKM